MNKGKEDQAAMKGIQSPELSDQQTAGFQTAQPQIAQSGGVGGLLGSAAGMVGGGGETTTTDASTGSTPDLSTNMPSKLTGFNGLKTKLY